MRFVAEHAGQAILHGEIVGQHASIPGLYEVRLAYEGDLVEILLKIAAPVYSTYTRQRWNLEYYQNLHGQVPGSVELPAAGRHFSSELLSRLTAYGVQIVYITLHTGMSNLMITEERVSDHSMYDEYFSIDEATAETITRGREQGGRVFGVGTTVMRALESVADERGRLKPFSGWTSLFISPGFRFKIIDIFLTNFHGPRTTRLALAMAFAGIDLVKRGYLEAIDQKYLFYEFGDATLTI
jgi:S-adenosylmethionine:tRNA ribosyltransferase-isomerase